MRVFAVVAVAVLLSGCNGTWSWQPPINLNLTGSDYCDIAAVIRYSKKDTRDTITQVRRENAKHGRVCGKGKRK